MPKEVNFETFLEFFSHRIMEIAIPVIITLICDAALTRFLEQTRETVAMDRSFSTIITADSDSDDTPIGYAIIVAVSLIVLIIIATALILVCYYYGCVKCIMVWMGIAVTILLSFYLIIALGNVPKLLNIPSDWLTVVLFIINFTVIGDLSIFWRAPEIFTHVYLIFISVLIALVFLNLPDWTVWILLGILVIYDCCVVLCPHGLLNVIIQKSEERGDSIPALVYSAAVWISKSNRSDDDEEKEEEEKEGEDVEEGEEKEEEDVEEGEEDGDSSGSGGDDNKELNDISPNNGASNNNNGASNNDNNNDAPLSSIVKSLNNITSSADKDDSATPDINLVDSENPGKRPQSQNLSFKSGRKSGDANDEANAPLLPPNNLNSGDNSDGTLPVSPTRALDDDDINTAEVEKKGGESDKKKKKRKFESDDDEGIKLGLGDFVFYGILITRAARVGWDLVILCLLAVILGLALTLILLAIFQRPLPALPFSLVLGIIFYFTGIYTFRPFHSNITDLKITF